MKKGLLVLLIFQFFILIQCGENDLPKEVLDTLENQFSVITVIIAAGVALAAALRYVYNVYRQSKKNPSLVSGFIFIGCMYIGYNIWAIAKFFSTTDAIDLMVRSSLAFGIMTVLFAPFLLLAPTRPMTIDRDFLFKALQHMESIPKESKSYFTKFIIFLLVVMQGFVIYAIYDLTWNEWELGISLILGIIVAYFLLACLSLTIYYAILLDKDVVIGNVNVVETIRRTLKINRRKKPPLKILSHPMYRTVYLIVFALATFVVIFGNGSLYYNDAKNFSSLDNSSKAVSIIFFVVFQLVSLYLAIRTFFLGIDRVRIVSEFQLEDGTIVELNTIKFISIVRSRDLTPLASFATTKDEFTKKIINSFLDHLPNANRDAGYNGTVKVDPLWVLFQQNDHLNMFFLGTGNSYNSNVATHLLSQIQLYVRKNYYTEEGLETLPLTKENSIKRYELLTGKEKKKRKNQSYFANRIYQQKIPYDNYTANSLNDEMKDFLKKLSKLYSDENEYQRLITEANVWFERKMGLRPADLQLSRSKSKKTMKKFKKINEEKDQEKLKELEEEDQIRNLINKQKKINKNLKKNANNLYLKLENDNLDDKKKNKGKKSDKQDKDIDFEELEDQELDELIGSEEDETDQKEKDKLKQRQIERERYLRNQDYQATKKEEERKKKYLSTKRNFVAPSDKKKINMYESEFELPRWYKRVLGKKKKKKKSKKQPTLKKKKKKNQKSNRH